MNRYPYTDMHEMNLDWILLKVKEMIAEWDTTKNAWTELKEFVETYFENLDVQQEINNKLDEMAAGGELAELMQPYLETQLPIEVANQIGDVVALQISAVVATQLPGVVANQLPAVAATAAAAVVGDWLAAHVDPETGYVIDDTLSVTDAAADAKATGDAVNDVKNAIAYGGDARTAQTYSFSSDNCTEGYYLEIVNNQGVLSENIVANALFCYTDYIDVKEARTAYVGSGKTNACMVYDGDKNIIGSSQIQNLDDNLQNLYTNAGYIRFNLTISTYGMQRLIVCKKHATIAKSQIVDDSINLILDSSNTWFNTLKKVLDYIDIIRNVSDITVNVYVSEGTYNALDGYDLANQPSTFVGPILQDNVNIIGVGSPENILIRANLPVDMTPYQFTAGDVSTINCWKNNKIKNVTLSMYNGRYAMHNDDYKTNAVEDAVEEFDSVRFISRRDLAAALSAGFSVGCGAYNGRKTVFKNCYFEAETFVSTNVVVHNNISSPKLCEWTFESCEFKNATASLRIVSNVSEQTDVINVKGCKIDGQFRFDARTEAQTETDFLIYGYGNYLALGESSFDFRDNLTEGDTLNMLLQIS